jgi:hypothetical protein
MRGWTNSIRNNYNLPGQYPQLSEKVLRQMTQATRHRLERAKTGSVEIRCAFTILYQHRQAHEVTIDTLRAAKPML